MIINPESIDTYIAKKGLVPRLDENQWHEILERIAAIYGNNLWHRCRLVHQKDDTFDRYSTDFPGSVPRPYRFIRHLELLLAHESPKIEELKSWLDDNGVVFSEGSQSIGLRIYGYEPDEGN